MSPLFPPLAAAGGDSSTGEGVTTPGGDSIGDSVTHFKRDLLEYLFVYRHSRVTHWSDVVRQHDLSAAK